MNVLKRAFLYDTRKRGKSLTLFLLFTLITIFVTISFSVLSATQAAATNLRETVGASFTLRGNPMEFSADETDFAIQFAPISQQDIDLIADSTETKACNAQQSATATASGFIFPSGMPSGAISANTSSAWNRNFTSGIVTLAEGRHITQDDQRVALVSRELAEENELDIGSELSLDPAAVVKIIGIYESDPSMEFDNDTIFTDHSTYWVLTESAAGTYSGRVDFFVTDPARLETVMEQIKRDVPLRWEDYTLQADTAEYDAIAYQLLTIGRLTTLLIVSAMIVSIVVLFLILAMRIRGRVHEVGVLLAVGVTKGHIIAQFFVETTTILLLAFLFSCPVSYFAVVQIGTFLRDMVGAVNVDLPAWKLLLQYGIETFVVFAGV
ncbi:MAG: FtsX-like permease family protein, partial [Lachnospiraceae bacterium]|nr:FtsX-like permease family protein [Lachnospiraceae bacterium]